MFFRKKKLSEVEFSHKFIKALQKRVKGLVIVSIEGLDVITMFSDSQERRHFLDNAYLEYLSETSRLKEIIMNYVEASEELYLPDEPININNIIPIIKDKRFINGLSEIYPDQESQPIYIQYNSSLYIFFAEDTPRTISYLSSKCFKELGLTVEELKNISLDNLARYEYTISGGSKIYMITAGGYCESSLILLNIWNKEIFAVKGEIVIGIPSREIVLVTGSKDSEGLHKVYDLVKEINDAGDHLVSDKLYEYKDGKFEVFQL